MPFRCCLIIVFSSWISSLYTVKSTQSLSLSSGAGFSPGHSWDVMRYKKCAYMYKRLERACKCLTHITTWDVLNVSARTLHGSLNKSRHDKVQVVGLELGMNFYILQTQESLFKGDVLLLVNNLWFSLLVPTLQFVWIQGAHVKEGGSKTITQSHCFMLIPCRFGWRAWFELETIQRLFCPGPTPAFFMLHVYTSLCK